MDEKTYVCLPGVTPFGPAIAGADGLDAPDAEAARPRAAARTQKIASRLNAGSSLIPGLRISSTFRPHSPRRRRRSRRARSRQPLLRTALADLPARRRPLPAAAREPWLPARGRWDLRVPRRAPFVPVRDHDRQPDAPARLHDPP